MSLYHVSLSPPFEPNINTMCPHCDTELEWYGEEDPVDGTDYITFDTAIEINGVMWCDETCELLSRLDMRPFLLQRMHEVITFELPELAGFYATQLVRFSVAFEQAVEAMGGRL